MIRPMVLILTLGLTFFPQASRGVMTNTIPKEDLAEAPATEPGFIGVTIQIEAERVGEPARARIHLVLPGSPAARSGLQPEDEIVSIHDQPVERRSLGELRRLLRGKPGTVISLRIKTPEGVKTVEIERITYEELLKRAAIQDRPGERIELF